MGGGFLLRSRRKSDLKGKGRGSWGRRREMGGPSELVKQSSRVLESRAPQKPDGKRNVSDLGTRPTRDGFRGKIRRRSRTGGY